jgi:hypothetical protein
MTIWLLVYSGKLRSLIQAYYYFVRSVQCRLIWPILVPVHPRFRPRFSRLSLKHGGPHLSDKIVLHACHRILIRPGVA